MPFPADPPTFYKTPFGDHDAAELERRTQAAGLHHIWVENARCKTTAESADHFAIGLVRGDPIALAFPEPGTVSHEAVERWLAAAFRRETGDHPVRTTLHAGLVTATAVSARSCEHGRSRPHLAAHGAATPGKGMLAGQRHHGAREPQTQRV